MDRIAKFEKVSYEQFEKDWLKNNPQDSQEQAKEIYDQILLPQRATSGSAGYDFHAPASFTLEPGSVKLIPTGIRARIKDGWVLMLFPRSSLGFRYRMQLNNTAGIIDADYYHADNEGHIMVKIINDSRDGRTLSLKAGDGMVQGIFVPFGITEDDQTEGIRTGGLGSTDSRRR